MPKPQRARAPQKKTASAPNRSPETRNLSQARLFSQQRPRDPQAWIELGNLQLKAEPQQALMSFERALDLLPDDPQTLELVAKAAQKLGQADRAQELVIKALGIEPDFAPAHHRLATIYFEKGKFANALKHIDQALELVANDCRMLSRKGLILNRLERYSDAIEVFEQLLKREPGDYSHWNNAANLYMWGAL